MVCPACGAANDAGRKFCGACGRALATACTRCGSANPPTVQFCGECGAALRPPASGETVDAALAQLPRVAERRLVSVLFADLVGFTSLAEHRDPEEVRDLLSRYFEISRDIVERFGGTIEKFIGDAIMAVWGTPTAHEDDAERAVRAALELLDAIAEFGRPFDAPDLQLRAGVLTGEAAVTIGAQGQGMVAGDLVNTASRLQSVAPAGTVLVGENTYLAAKRAVAFEEVGEQALKGRQLPVAAWRALRIVAGKRGEHVSDVLEPPFVDRVEELRLIRDLFHATLRDSKPRLVSVTGVAGIGKSRLAWELHKYVDGLARPVLWLQGRSPAYGEGLTFWALGEMVRTVAGVAESDDAATTRPKLTATIARFVQDSDDRHWIEPRLAHLLALEENPRGGRDELFAAWRIFIEQVSEAAPAVLVFEDLQWADPGLLDFIEHVLEASRAHPIFVLTLARLEIADRYPNWGAGQRNFTSLHLEPLADDAMRALVTNLAPGLPDDLVEKILERGEGIPLYAVETIRMLVDQGHLMAQDGTFRPVGELTRLGTPDSLHALISARLDGLTEEDRAILQDASVLGKTFTVPALAAITGDSSDALERRLGGLVKKDLLLLDADPRSPERGQYGFVQGLIQEVAYQTPSKKDRRARHLAAAHYFEGLQDEELASVVATHYLQAYQATPPGPDAAAVAARAQDSLAAAADRADSLGSHVQALGYVEQALQVTGEPARRAQLWQRAAEAAEKASRFDDAERYLRQAIEWHEQRGDVSGKARATALLGTVLLDKEQWVDAVRLLDDAYSQLSSDERDPGVVELAGELARAYFIRADRLNQKEDLVTSIEWADRALRTAESLGLDPVIADVLVSKGVAQFLLGRYRESVILLTGALELARELGLARAELRAIHNLSGNQLWYNQPRAAFAAARDGMALASKLGLAHWRIGFTAMASVDAINLGEWEWATSSLAELRQESFPSDLTVTWLTWPEVALKAFTGDFQSARQTLARARAALVDLQDEASVRASQATIAFAEGKFDHAHQLAIEGAGLGREWLYELAARTALWLKDLKRAASASSAFDQVLGRGAFIDGKRLLMRAGVAVLEGRRAEGLALYQEGFRTLRDLGALFQLALAELDLVALLGGGDPDARAAGEDALEIFTRLGAKPFLERLESALRSPQEISEPA
jgi:class 3 adenylate cyclase/tetratricopeptide (TPR) repeat protein